MNTEQQHLRHCSGIVKVSSVRLPEVNYWWWGGSNHVLGLRNFCSETKNAVCFSNTTTEDLSCIILQFF